MNIYSMYSCSCFCETKHRERGGGQYARMEKRKVGDEGVEDGMYSV